MIDPIKLAIFREAIAGRPLLRTVDMEVARRKEGADVEASLEARGWTAEKARAEAGCDCSPPQKRD